MILRNEQRVVILARFVAREGMETELIETLAALMPLTRREEGCIRYELNQQVDKPRVVTYVEKFSSQAAVDLHAATDYIKSYFANDAPRLAETIDVTYHREVLA